MTWYDRSLNPELLTFWYEFGEPGRIGLIHLDFAPAKIFNWGQRWVTPSHEPSRWTHTFVFLPRRHGVPWIAESDALVRVPGFEKNKVDGPQINSIHKWSHFTVDQAAVLETGLTDEQLSRGMQWMQELTSRGVHYPRRALVGTLLALAKGDLAYSGPFAKDLTMHCSQLVRDLLHAAGVDPFGKVVLSRNVTPEHLAQIYPLAASWSLAEGVTLPQGRGSGRTSDRRGRTSGPRSSRPH